LGAGGVFRESVAAYRHRFGTLIATAAVLDLPYAALYYVLAKEPPALSTIPTNEEISAFLGAMGPWLVIRLLITSILFAAVIRTVGETYAGVESSWRETTAAAISRMVSLAVVTVLFWSGVTLGSALFVFPGLFLVVAWSATLSVVIIEGGGPLTAFARSWLITSGRRMAIFGVLVAVSVLVVFANLVLVVALGGLLGFLLGAPGPLLASEIVWVLTQPFIAVVLAVLYLDLRVRKEELDTDWLSLQISATSFDS
jgi:hypothetical protein